MSNISYDEQMFEFLEHHIGHDIKCGEYDSDGAIGVSIWCDKCGVTLLSGERVIKDQGKKVMKCPACGDTHYVSQAVAGTCVKCRTPLISTTK